MNPDDQNSSRHFRPPKMTGLARGLRQTMTFPERLLWGLLRGGKLEGLKFRRQHPIGRYVADFCCEKARLVVELDGMSHVGTGDRDDERTRELGAFGLRVIRFTNDEVIADSLTVAEAIARAAGVDL